jgi:CDP-4-dehydro-6-deoxyglucose reductase
MPKWTTGSIEKIEDTSPTVKTFWIRVQQEDKLDFKPGQFVTWDLPISEKRLGRWRSYSIANPPNGKDLLEFSIVKVDEGGATKYLWEEAKVGTEIKFKGPDGMFILPENIDYDMVMICTGTGVAPFRSMIKYLDKHIDIPRKKIHLIYGTRYSNNLLYREEFRELEDRTDWFKYDVALSREDIPGAHQGYIHQIYMNEYSVHRDDIKFYLCGWTNMIDEAVANLMIKLKYKPSQIKYELYG